MGDSSKKCGIYQEEIICTIVEYGAGTGVLCHDILDYLRNNKQFYDQLNYCIIEKSPVMREKQKAHLYEKVSWHNTIQDIPEITGCILSNELLDNFSVYQVVMEDELMEVFVDYKDGFVELLRPAKKALTDYMAELSVVLPKGFRTEINLEATEWIKEIAASLKKGM
ncbi:MAG: class I SAM-dependent methyltransferase [Segetibacter sp.]